MQHKYTQEEKQFFIDFVTGHSYKEIQAEFIERFGWGISLSQIHGYIGRNKLNTGRTCRFEKGQEAINKGKKMPPETYKKVSRTMFKKVHVPANHKPVGSERIDAKDGYVFVKVKEPGTWKLKHRLIWEEHNGPIPKGCVIIFRDGNRLNTDISNLMMISRADNAILNKKGLYIYQGKLKDTAVGIARLSKILNGRRKKGGKS